MKLKVNSTLLTKSFFLLVCSLLTLTSCTLDNNNSRISVSDSSAIETDIANAEIDPIPQKLFTDPSIHRQSVSFPGSFVETTTGIYYELDHFLYYADAGSSTFTILCGRPECEHNDEDCDAYLPQSSFTIYEDEIYYYDSSTRDGIHYIELWKRQLDGSSHEKIKDVFDIHESTVGVNGYFHQGYFYYPHMNIGLIRSGFQGTGLYRTSLDRDGELEKVLDIEVQNLFMSNTILSLSFYENYLYIVGSNDQGKFELWQHNLDTGQMLKLLDNWSVWGNLYTDDTIYYYQPQEGFYEYDIKSDGNQLVADDILKEKGIDTDDEFGVSYTEQYILLYELALQYKPEAAKVFVFNWDYELLNEFEVQSDDFSIAQPAYLATTSDYVYFIEFASRDAYELISYAIPVSELLEDDVPIYEVETHR